LTAAGELLVRHAEAIVARLEAAQADFEALAAGEAGALRVGTYQSVSRQILPLLLRRFGQVWPRVDLRVTEEQSDEELARLVEHGDIDLSFADFRIWDGPYDWVHLLDDPYVVLVQAGSPLAVRRRKPTLAEVAELPLIGFRLCGTTRLVESQFHGEGLHPEFVFRSDDNGTVQAMVSAGLGIAVAPRLTVDLNDPSTVAIPFDGIPPRQIGLAWHRDRYRSPAARAFADVAVEVCREFAAPRGRVA
jgi:DNA-binding transcriptional LysR family regulator